MAHEFVTPVHPELGEIRCTRAAYDAVYFDKGFRLRPAFDPPSETEPPDEGADDQATSADTNPDTEEQ